MLTTVHETGCTVGDGLYCARMTSLDPYRSLFDLAGSSAAVVGAGSGIGQASAFALAAHGAAVTCADLDADSAAATAAAIVADGGEATSTSVDITDTESVDALFASGPFGTAVITPSINVRKQLLDMSEDEFARVVDLNLKGTFTAMRAAGR